VTFGADNGKKWRICSIAALLPAPYITAHDIRRQHGADNRARAAQLVAVEAVGHVDALQRPFSESHAALPPLNCRRAAIMGPGVIVTIAGVGNHRDPDRQVVAVWITAPQGAWAQHPAGQP